MFCRPGILISASYTREYDQNWLRQETLIHFVPFFFTSHEPKYCQVFQSLKKLGYSSTGIFTGSITFHCFSFQKQMLDHRHVLGVVQGSCVDVAKDSAYVSTFAGWACGIVSEAGLNLSLRKDKWMDSFRCSHRVSRCKKIEIMASEVN